MMICPSCGFDVPEKPFCDNCGKPLGMGAPMENPKTTVDRIFASVGLPTSDQQIAQASVQGDRLAGGVSGSADAQDVASQTGFEGAAVTPSALYSLEVLLPESQVSTSLQPGSASDVAHSPEASPSAPEGGPKDDFDRAPEFLEVPKRTTGRTVGIVVGVVIAVLAICAAVFMSQSLGKVSGGASSTDAASDQVGQSQALVSPSSPAASASSADAASSAVSSSASSESSSEASSASSTASPSASSASASSASSAASSSSSPASSNAKASFDPECFDAHGNASLYLVCELSGKKMKSALEQNGYSWVEGANAWMTRKGAIVEVQNADGTLSAKQLAKLKKGAAGTPAVYVIMTNGYSSPKEALDGMAEHVNLNDNLAYDDDEEITFARISGSSGDEMLVAVTKTADEQQTFLVFNQSAIEQGLFTSVVGVTAGTSIDEIWEVLDK